MGDVARLPRLLEAVVEGRADEVEQLLATCTAPGIANAAVNKALMLAASSGDAEVVHLLLAAGAAADSVDSSAQRLTPLWMAVIGGHVEVVRQLLAAGASVDKPRRDCQMTPLMFVACNGNEGIVQQLLAAGASVNATDSKSGTALFVAALNGRCGVVRRLLAAGAAVDTADVDGFTPLMTAASAAHADVVLLLTEAGQPPMPASRTVAQQRCTWQRSPSAPPRHVSWRLRQAQTWMLATAVAGCGLRAALLLRPHAPASDACQRLLCFQLNRPPFLCPNPLAVPAHADTPAHRRLVQAGWGG